MKIEIWCSKCITNSWIKHKDDDWQERKHTRCGKCGADYCCNNRLYVIEDEKGKFYKDKNDKIIYLDRM